MILVCGGLADGVTELVCSRLQDCGYPYRLLDLARFPEDYRVSWRWTDSGPQGWIAAANWRLDLDAISSVYVRFLGPEDRPPLPTLDPADAAALRGESDLGLMALLEDLPCPVVNRMGGGLSNNSKPYQALVISGTGLSVPPTLVTSDPVAARAFHAEHGEVIYKSASGIRSIVRRLGPDHLARLDLLCDGPAQFQAFVPGHNIRVHTVGDRVFATRIESEAVDYRYAHADGLAANLEAVTLPQTVEAACLRLAHAFDLLFAGIDLKRDSRRRVLLLRGQSLPGLSLLRASHRTADQHGARRSAATAPPRPARRDRGCNVEIRPPANRFNQGGRTMARKPADKPSKKPFIAKADRPEVRLKSDTPLGSNLTVRDLATILGQLGTGKDFWDGKDWQKDDFDGPGNKWKEIKEGKEVKEVKEKEKEFKEGKEVKEKREHKELKAEKLELDGVSTPFAARSARRTRWSARSPACRPRSTSSSTRSRR